MFTTNYRQDAEAELIEINANRRVNWDRTVIELGRDVAYSHKADIVFALDYVRFRIADSGYVCFTPKCGRHWLSRWGRRFAPKTGILSGQLIVVGLKICGHGDLILRQQQGSAGSLRQSTR